MKDIVNPNVREALERLERAIVRLDSAAAIQGAGKDVAPLKQELEQLRRDHASLSSSATRVADRLDGVIAQVRASLGE